MRSSVFHALAFSFTLAVCAQVHAQGITRATTIRSTHYTSGQGVVYAHPSYLPPDATTLELWIRRDNTNNGYPMTAIGGLGIWFEEPRIGDPNKLTLAYRFDAPVETDVVVPAGTWCHLAVTVERSTDDSPSPAFVFVNGELADAVWIDASRESAGDWFAIGHPFEGLLDEVRIWNYARSAEEIRADYQREVRGAAGLVAVLPHGGGRELIRGIDGTTPVGAVLGEPSSFGVLPASAWIPELLTTPTIDGILNPVVEYPGSPVGFLSYASFESRMEARIRIGHRDGEHFVAVEGLPRPPGGEEPHALDVYLRARAGDDPVLPAPEPVGARVDLARGGVRAMRLEGDEWIECAGEECAGPDRLEAGLDLGNDGRLSVEIRFARELFDALDSGGFDVALRHTGWSGVCTGTDDPLAAVLPPGSNPFRPETWLEVSHAMAPDGADGSCSSPIMLDEGTSVISFAGASNEFDGLSCLPGQQAGADLVCLLSVAEPGDYRIFARPREDEANLSLALLENCSAESCLIATDAQGRGRGETLIARLDDKPLFLVIDHDSGADGQDRGEIDFVLERLPEVPTSAPLKVVRAQGVLSHHNALLDSLFSELWIHDTIDVLGIGLATEEQIEELGETFAVDIIEGADYTKAEPQPQPPPAPPPTLHFDRYRYDPAGAVDPCFYLYAGGPGLDAVQEVWVASTLTEDVERVELVDRGSVFTPDPGSLVLTLESTGPEDQQLSVEPGDRLVAYWFDPRSEPSVKSTAAAIARVTGASEPLGLLPVDTELTPPVPEVPGRAPGEPPRPLGVLSGSGIEMHLGLDQVIFAPRDEVDRARFESRWNATLVDDGSFPGSEDAGGAALLYRIDPGAVDGAGLEDMLTLLGLDDKLAVSDPKLHALLAVIADETLRGSQVSPNLVLESFDRPITNDPFNGPDNASGETIPTSGDAFRDVYARDCIQGIGAAWLMTSLLDLDIPVAERATEHVAVGVIDTNFCPELSGDIEILGGFDFVRGVADPFGLGETFGFGGPFHGTRIASILGSKHNNGVGVAGVGGQVAALRLYNIGGLGFLHDLDKAIRKATIDGCEVINMSLGIPTKIAGLNFSNPWTALACPVVGAALQTALPIISATAGVPVPPVGPLAVDLCFTLVAILSEARDSMEDALEFAVRRGVVCLASSGNATEPFGEATIERFHLIPAILPNCIAVGATDASYDNLHLFGSSVDIWVIDSARVAAPQGDGPSCGPFTEKFVGGTSSACAIASGVVALMRAANPSLSHRQIRDILRSTALRSPPPRSDPRVRRFLRADLALVRALSPRTSPSVLSPVLARDEYRDPESDFAASFCIPEAQRRETNDTPGTAIEFPVSDFQVFEERDLGLHDYTASGLNEEDHFVIAAAPSARECMPYEVQVTTESHAGSGLARSRFGVRSRDTSESTRGVSGFSTWRSVPIFLRDPLPFEVAGDDTVYHLSGTIRALGQRASDGFEPNDRNSEAAELSAAQFTRTEGNEFIVNELVVRRLNFHCPDDVDVFSITLPTEVEDCLDLASTCGLGNVVAASNLLITSGAVPSTLRDASGRVLATNTTHRIPCPRGLGLDRFTLTLPCDGRHADIYDLRVVYTVPVNVDDVRRTSQAIDDWICCYVQQLPGCGGDPADPPSNATDQIISEIWNPHGRIEHEFFFDGHCPLATCNPGPQLLHAMRWPEGAPATAGFEVVTPSSLTGFRLDLLDDTHTVVATAVPGRRAAGFKRKVAGGTPDDECDGSEVVWRLETDAMTPGIWVLRASGVRPGDRYVLRNLDPLPPVSTTNGSRLDFAAETGVQPCFESPMHLLLRADEPVSAFQLGLEWDRPELIESIEFSPGPDLDPDSVQSLFVLDGTSAQLDDHQAIVGLVLNAGVTFDATEAVRALTIRVRPSSMATPGDRVRFCPVGGLGSPPIDLTVTVQRDGNSIGIEPEFSCGDLVVLADGTPPEISCPGEIVVDELPRGELTPVEFEVTAIDDCGDVEMDSSHESGAGFPVGETVVRVTARDTAGNSSACEFVVRVEPAGVEFRRGDANDDRSVNISDAVQILNYLFADGLPPPCPDAADSNDDHSVNISDAVQILNYLFADGSAPPAPGPDDCGRDPAPSGLAECVTQACP